jgi:DNA invertase Pin-like site-specific DNA recombinase
MESGVDFVAADMPHADRFMLHIFAAMAEEEGRRISDRTKSALAAAKARGVKLGANGHRLAQTNRDAAQRYAESLRPTIANLPEEEKSSLRATARALNNQGVSSPSNGLWHPASVARLLKRLEL